MNVSCMANAHLRYLSQVTCASLLNPAESCILIRTYKEFEINWMIILSGLGNSR